MDNQLWVWLGIGIVVDLVIAAMRASLVHVRLPHLISRRDENFAAVDRALALLEKPQLSASLRFSLALMHFILAAQAWLIASQLFVSASVGVLLLVAFLATLIILGIEFALEGIILRDPEGWAMRFAPLATFVDIVFRPVSWVLMSLLGSPESLHRSMGSVTEDELKTWVEEGQPEGSLERGERKMIYSIFHFSDTLCREIMVPRIDVLALDVNTSREEAVEAVRQSGHSRFPVYEEVIDDIIGLLYAKDLLEKEADQPRPIRDLLRPAYFVPEAKKVDELLREMQARGVHMAVVVDEYGGMAGLVTLEDIVEEIVGEIRDEYDEKEELPFQKINADEYLFQGRIDLDDFNELLGTHLTKEIADTLGGFLYGEIGGVPLGGEEVTIDGWKLTVEQVSGRRIRLVRALRKPAESLIEEKSHDSER